MNFTVWRTLAGVLTWAMCCQIAVKSLRPEMDSSLETGTSRWSTVEISSQRLRDKSVMSVREKCDEKSWEEPLRQVREKWRT